MKQKINSGLKSLYFGLLAVVIALSVTRITTITSLAGGEGTLESPCETVEDTTKVFKQKLMAHQATFEIFFNFSGDQAAFDEYFNEVSDGIYAHNISTPNGGEYIRSNMIGRSSYGAGPTTTPGVCKLTFKIPRDGYRGGFLSTPTEEAETIKALDDAYASLDLANVTDDYEKVKTIYDYVRLNVTYDKSREVTDGSDNPDNENFNLESVKRHSTYSAAVERHSVCQGYSSMLYYLMLKAGIDCHIVTGTAKGYGSASPERHAWNIVKIGDDWYNVDATWDSDSGTDTYFLLSDSTIGSASYGSHTRDGESVTIACTKDNPFRDDGGIDARMIGCSFFAADTINVVFYFDAKDFPADTTNKVVFKIPGEADQTFNYSQRYGTGTITDTSGSTDYVSFACGVPAKHMSDVIEAQVISGDGTKKSEVFRTSVKKFADVTLEKGKDLGVGSLSNYSLEYVKALLFYGRYAQEYFNVQPTVYADAGLDQSENRVTAATFKNANVAGWITGGYVDKDNGFQLSKMNQSFYENINSKTLSDGNITYYGSCLVLESKVVVRHYFTITSATDLENYKFYLRGEEVEPYTNGQYICIETSGYSPKQASTDLLEGNYVKVKKGDNFVITFQYNPMDYIYKVMSDDRYSTNTNLVNLMKAYYWYSICAQRI